MKNYILLYISALKILRGSVYVKLSLTLSQNQRNNSFFKKVHDFWDTLYLQDNKIIKIFCVRFFLLLWIYMVCVCVLVHVCMPNVSSCGMIADRNPSCLDIFCENVSLIKMF